MKLSKQSEADRQRIALGSGTIYILEFGGEIPENSVIEAETNKIGYIQNGATLDYKPTFYEAKDDTGVRSKKIITDEEASLKSSLFTWNGNSFEKLTSTARVEENTTTKKRTVKIGGAENYNGKNYLIRFVHRDKQDGDLRITIVGSNNAGFSLAFAKDKEVTIDVEFSAKAMDNEGTLIMMEEDFIPETSESI